MSKIKAAFADGKAFIPFLTCGDPDLETTEALVRVMAEAGADLIELGIPFSDPTAEGPVIQQANIRALSGGVTTDKILEMARKLRSEISVPLVFMTYANVVFSYGTERFLSAAAQAGIAGLILPDVPFEEKDEFGPACRRHGLELISLIAPTSEGRVAEIAKAAEASAVESTLICRIVWINTGKTKAVIFCTFIGVGKHLISLINFFKLCFGLFIAGVQVGMILFGKPTVCLFNGILGRGTFDA